jgi:organic hydroperoxide reductase OsmC/OhrA
MATHFAEVEWSYKTHPQQPDTFDRDHTLVFENGQAVTGSSAPAYFGNAAAVNPETLLLAALASCHMLTFLAVAAKRGFQVSHYRDKAEGSLAKNAEGRVAITHCTLKPDITFSGDSQPSADDLRKMHESAHRNCFIANSLNSQVEISS